MQVWIPAARLWSEDDSDRAGKVFKVGEVILLLAAAGYLALFAALALLRFRSPVEYSSIEGYHLTQVHRLLEGSPLYPAPSLEYVPLMYGPLYPYVSAAAALLFGESYAAARAVSLLATLGVQAMIWLLVWRTSGSARSAWVAAGLYAGAYGAAGFFFDTARVDSLLVLLTLVAAYCIRVAASGGLMVSLCAACAASCAVLTKQTALAPVLALCAWSFAFQPGKGRRTALLCLGSIVVTQGLLAFATHSWSLYYLYEIPLAHRISPQMCGRFLIDELVLTFGSGVVLSSFVLVAMLRRRAEHHDALFFLLFFVGMGLAAGVPRIKFGGNVNNLIPLAVALAVGSGLALARVWDRRGWSPAVVMLLLLCFNLQLVYSPRQALPSARALQRTGATLEVLRRLEGRVLAPRDPYLALIAGKNPSFLWSAHCDVELAGGEEGGILKDQLRDALEGQRFRAIVLPTKFYLRDRFPFEQLEMGYRPLDRQELEARFGTSEPSLEVYLQRGQPSRSSREPRDGGAEPVPPATRTLCLSGSPHGSPPWNAGPASLAQGPL